VWNPFRSRLSRVREELQVQLLEARRRVLESTTAYFDQYVDPREAWIDEHGEEWLPLGAGGPKGGKTKITTPQELDAVRRNCRRLAEENEFAINGHENRVSYVVGPGLTYEFEIPEGSKVSKASKEKAQAWIDEVLDANDWSTREQEAVKRGDRDGECLIRVFWPFEGAQRVPRFRFIEPEDLRTPESKAGQAGHSWGIETDPDDVETVIAYHVQGDPEPIPAEDVTHVKLNVDKAQKRGVPTFYPVRKNLVRAEKLLRNMSAVATLQAAIALIREHDGFSKDQVEDFRTDGDDFTIVENATAKTRHFTKFGPGTIVDAPAGTKYQFPVAGVAADKFVIVLQAELRAVASRLVMPEFMFTADASNANYASTMVAEGPAVKFFQRLQSFWREHLISALWNAVEMAVRFGELPAEVLELELVASLPSLTVRDEEKEGKTLGREHEAGVLSKRTWSEIRGYDFEKEQARLDEERERSAESMGAFGLTPPPGGPGAGKEDDQEGDQEDDGDDEGDEE